MGACTTHNVLIQKHVLAEENMGPVQFVYLGQFTLYFLQNEVSSARK